MITKTRTMPKAPQESIQPFAQPSEASPVSLAEPLVEKQERATPEERVTIGLPRRRISKLLATIKRHVSPQFSCRGHTNPIDEEKRR